MEYNQDELSAPSWLSDAFFLHVLREYECDPTLRLSGTCELRPGTKAGDHFASVMYRTTVRYSVGVENVQTRPKTMNLIMKIKPVLEGLKKDLLSDDDFFGKEIRMYTKVLPEMARLMGTIGEVYHYPKLVYTSVEPHTIIILEDISPQGWAMNGLIQSYEEMHPTIDAIAKFHAASAIIQQHDPQFVSQYRCTIPDTFATMRNMTDACFRSFVKFLRETLACPEFIEPVERFHSRIDDSLREVYSPSDVCANVLIHGDFHFKNLLHRREGARIVDTMFVDYQMCSWSSQIVDLCYLLYMIPEQTVKNHHREDLIYRYHQQFCHYLRRLDFNGHIPSLMELNVELLRNGALELFHYIVFSAFRYIDLSKVDAEAFFLGRIDNPALEKEEFREMIRKELKRFHLQGVIA